MLRTRTRTIRRYRTVRSKPRNDMGACLRHESNHNFNNSPLCDHRHFKVLHLPRRHNMDKPQHSRRNLLRRDLWKFFICCSRRVRGRNVHRRHNLDSQNARRAQHLAGCDLFLNSRALYRSRKRRSLAHHDQRGRYHMDSLNSQRGL